ncbi:hypothetical protein D3C79_979170 [compost metagenome]
MRIAIHRTLRQPHLVQQLQHPAASLRCVAFAVDDEGLFQDLAHCVATVERFCRILKHYLHLLAQGSHLPG